jgi:two-component sensor histidine kinase
MINELVTNALKYAFPGERSGLVQVTLTGIGDFLRVTVEDDGVGMSGEVRGTGLGLRLLNSFARSLNGKVETSSGERGTRVSVTFPLERPAMEHRAETSLPYLH